MTLEQKKAFIFKDIAKHYNEFLRQSNIKINKKFVNSETDHIELVSYVLYSIVDKLEEKRYIEKFFEMTEQNMLFNYIVKAINIQCKSLNAPFLIDKLKERNRLRFNEDIEVEDKINEEEQEIIDYEDKVIDAVYKSFDIKVAPSIYGEEWEYYVTIFRQYIEEPKNSFRKLSDKFNVPSASIYRDFCEMKEMIIKHLKDEKVI